MTEEITSKPSQQSSRQNSLAPSRINLTELRNSDLVSGLHKIFLSKYLYFELQVSRYLAATPPYQYSTPVGPHNYFFSEMLRSLVQVRSNNEQTGCRNQNNSLPITLSGRRPRKRAWNNQQRPTYDQQLREHSEMDKSDIPTEKPLELTNKSIFPLTKHYQKSESPKILTTENSTRNANKINSQGEDDVKKFIEFPSNMDLNLNNKSDHHISSSVPSDLVLPPPPPMWYPPLYPPYGIDPLHFFIDLRVSGHIYDRKKEMLQENSSPTNEAVADNNNFIPPIDVPSTIHGKQRQGSAFSVPRSRRDTSPSSALNLSSVTSENKPDFNHTIEHHHDGYKSVKNANYVLQNLPRIYTHLSHDVGEDKNSAIFEEIDCKSDGDVQDTDDHDDRSDNNDGDVVIVDNKINRSETY